MMSPCAARSGASKEDNRVLQELVAFLARELAEVPGLDRRHRPQTRSGAFADVRVREGLGAAAGDIVARCSSTFPSASADGAVRSVVPRTGAWSAVTFACTAQVMMCFLA